MIRAVENILFKVQKCITQWDHISFTVEYKVMYKISYLQTKQLQLGSKKVNKNVQNAVFYCGPQSGC